MNASNGSSKRSNMHHPPLPLHAVHFAPKPAATQRGLRRGGSKTKMFHRADSDASLNTFTSQITFDYSLSSSLASDRTHGPFFDYTIVEDEPVVPTGSDHNSETSNDGSNGQIDYGFGKYIRSSSQSSLSLGGPKRSCLSRRRGSKEFSVADFLTPETGEGGIPQPLYEDDEEVVEIDENDVEDENDEGEEDDEEDYKKFSKPSLYRDDSSVYLSSPAEPLYDSEEDEETKVPHDSFHSLPENDIKPLYDDEDDDDGEAAVEFAEGTTPPRSGAAPRTMTVEESIAPPPSRSPTLPKPTTTIDESSHKDITFIPNDGPVEEMPPPPTPNYSRSNSAGSLSLGGCFSRSSSNSSLLTNLLERSDSTLMADLQDALEKKRERIKGMCQVAKEDAVGTPKQRQPQKDTLLPPQKFSTLPWSEFEPHHEEDEDDDDEEDEDYSVDSSSSEEESVDDEEDDDEDSSYDVVCRAATSAASVSSDAASYDLAKKENDTDAATAATEESSASWTIDNETLLSGGATSISSGRRSLDDGIAIPPSYGARPADEETKPNKRTTKVTIRKKSTSPQRQATTAVAASNDSPRRRRAEPRQKLNSHAAASCVSPPTKPRQKLNSHAAASCVTPPTKSRQKLNPAPSTPVSEPAIADVETKSPADRLEQRKQERAVRLARAKERIRLQQEQEEAESMDCHSPRNRELQRKRLREAYQWYMRCGFPTRTKFEQWIQSTPTCGILMADLDLLPWKEGTERIDAVKAATLLRS